MMNYEESASYIESLSPSPGKPTLERISRFFQEAGNWQNDIPCFLVAGTNGKGSTTSILDASLQSLGLKVGRFTGPHLLSWNERICLNGQAVSKPEFARLATEARYLSECFRDRNKDAGLLTWFEILTLMAFLYFKEQHVDCAVMEVGLGGRFDATNCACNVPGTIITNIDLDHTQILGKTVPEIAREKAGIIKPGIPVVTAACPEALAVIENRAAKLGAEVFSVGDGYLALNKKVSRYPEALELFEKAAEKLISSLSLIGTHQRVNAGLALSCLYHSGYLDELDSSRMNLLLARLRDNFADIYWPGRMHEIEGRNLLLDGAHNPAGASVLRKTLDENYKGPFTFIIGFYRNKDAESFLVNLLREGDRVVATEICGLRPTLTPEEIAQITRKLAIETKIASDSFTAMEIAYNERRHQNEQIIGTGSFAIVSSLMRTIGWQDVDDGRKPVNSPLANHGEIETSIDMRAEAVQPGL